MTGLQAVLQAALLAFESPPRIVPPAAFEVPARERAAEDRRLRALGLRPPAGGLVIRRPFAPPLSRRSYVVPQRWLLADPPVRIHAPALRADLPALREVMQIAYGGWQTAAARGWDWQKWFSDWDAALAVAGDGWLSTRVASDPMRKLLEFQLDNHTNIPLGTMLGSESSTALLARAPAGPCVAIRDRSGRPTPTGTAAPWMATGSTSMSCWTARPPGAATGS